MTGVLALFEYVKVHKIIKISSICLASVVSFGYIVARLLSGQHYFTDIVAGLLLSLTIIALFIALKQEFVKVEEVKEE